MSENKDSYNVTVNEDTELELTEKEWAHADIQSFSGGVYHLILNGKSLHYEVESIDLNNKEVHLKSNGKVYRVSIKDKLDKLIESMGMEVADALLESNLNAPMPGLVLEIFVAAGDEVEEGDQLLILEAMKMENVIKSPGVGIIKEVRVNPGESVDKGDVLLEFE